MYGGRSMGRKNEKRMDLLDLPVAERKRLCLEIHAALRERVAVGKIPVSDDAIIATKSMWDSPDLKPFDEGERDPDSLRRRSLLNSLAKRIW
jgi:hypothetical protein